MSEIEIDKQGQLLWLRMNRPARKNALTHAMYTTLTQGLQQARDDQEVRVVVITGSEGNFSAGNDMHDFLQHPPQGQDSPVMRFLAELIAFPKPVVAAVEGVAVGIGTTLLLHCDLVYVAPSARLKLPFVNLGLCPEAGSSLVLPALMGHQRAAELLLLGEMISGAKAVELGLANALSEDCVALAEAQARRLAAQPPAALRLSKQLMRQGSSAALQQQMATEGAHFFKRLLSEEAREAMQSFVEKRAPDFSRFV